MHRPAFGVKMNSSGIGVDMDPNPTEDASGLAYIIRELDSLRAGLSMLGLKQCSCCRKYFQCPDGKNLLNASQLVCYMCLEGWWRRESPRLNIGERRVAERQILRWLVAYHGAKVIRQIRQMPEADAIELKMVVGCEQCGGTGKRDNGICQNCDGRGSEWVVVIKPQMR